MTPSAPSGDRLVIKVVAVGIGFLVAFGAGLVCGGLGGEIRSERRHLAEQRDAVLPVLASDPAFADVRVSPDDDGGWILLEGEVATLHRKT